MRRLFRKLITKQIIAFIGLAACCCSNLHAQQTWRHQRDSLFSRLHSAKNDTLRVDELLAIGENYQANNQDSAVHYYNTANRLSYATGYFHGKMRYLACMTEILVTQAKYTDALKLCLQSVALAKKYNKRHMLAGAYNNVADVYDDLGDRPKALQYYQSSIALYQQLSTHADSANLATVYCNILSLYASLEQPDNAYKYGVKALALSRATHNTDAEVIAYTNFCSVLIRLNRCDTAMVLAKQQYSLCKRINDKTNAAAALGNMNSILLKTGKPQAVKKNAGEMLQLSTASNDIGGIAVAYYYLAYYYFKLKDLKNAKMSNDRALKIISDNKINNAGIHLLASDLALAMGNMDAYDQQRNIADSLHDVDLSNKVLKYNQELQVQYDVTTRRAEINDLHKEREIQKLKISQQKITTAILMGLFVVLVFAGLLYFRNNQQKNALLRAEDLIKQQRITELENEHKLLLTETMLKSQEEERTRIAKDLHDGLGGILSGAKFSLSSMKQNFILTEDNVLAFERTMEMLDHSIAELRRVAHNMMPENLLRLTLNEALMGYCQQINDSGTVAITYQSFGMDGPDLENTIKISVYRIAQELLNNLVKHAKASAAMVQLIVKDNELNITIEDDGKGFDVETLKHTTGIGYKSLVSRVEFLKGKINIQSVHGKGTHVYVEIPLV